MQNKKQASVFPKTSKWGMAGVWNKSLTSGSERAVVARERLWASELGKPNIELFLKLKGVAPSNPPNDRSKRKFEAGHLTEWIVQVILNRAGILKSTQEWIEYQYPKLLSVSGKLDFIAGGTPNYERWEQWDDLMKKLEMPEMFLRVNDALKEHFEKAYPEGLTDAILEIKSCSSFAMNAMEATGKSSRNHRLQNFHYLKAKNMEHGRVVYICRDDLRMFEVEVSLSDKEVEAEYRGAIEEITAFYNVHKNTPLDKFIIPGEEGTSTFLWLEGMPPLEKNIVWDNDYKKFARNWGVEYSSYLTMLYGFTDQKMFEDAVMPTVAKWNSAMRRLKKIETRKAWLAQYSHTEEGITQDKIEGTRKKGKQYVFVHDEKVFLPDDIQGSITLSPGNLEAIEEMKREGFKVEELAAEFSAGDESEEEVSA